MKICWLVCKPHFPMNLFQLLHDLRPLRTGSWLEVKTRIVNRAGKIRKARKRAKNNVLLEKLEQCTVFQKTPTGNAGTII